MGVIQGSINNLIALSAAAVKLSSGLEKGRETKSLEKDIKTNAGIEVGGHNMQKDGSDSSEHVNPISYEEKLARRQNAVYDSMIDLEIKQNEIRNSRRRDIKPCLV